MVPLKHWFTQLCRGSIFPETLGSDGPSVAIWLKWHVVVARAHAAQQKTILEVVMILQSVRKSLSVLQVIVRLLFFRTFACLSVDLGSERLLLPRNPLEEAGGFAPHLFQLVLT